MLKQELLLQEAVERFKKQTNVRAVFVSGSFARGEQHALSDIDLVLIVRRPQHFVRYFSKAIHIEVEAYTLAELPKRLLDNPMSFYSLSELKPLYDPHRLYKKVSTTVRQFGRNYRAPALLKADLFIQLTHYQSKLLAKVNSKNKLIRSALLIGAREKSLEALAAVNNIPPMPLPKMVSDWKKFSKKPAHFSKLIDHLLIGPLGSQTKATLSLIKYELPQLKGALKQFRQYYKAW